MPHSCFPMVTDPSMLRRKQHDALTFAEPITSQFHFFRATISCLKGRKILFQMVDFFFKAESNDELCPRLLPLVCEEKGKMISFLIAL